MTGQLEVAIYDLLKSVLLDVASEVLLSPLSNRNESEKSDALGDRLLLRSSEAAEILAISERQLYSMTRSGILPCIRVGRLVRYNPETIKSWIRQSETATKPEYESAPKQKKSKLSKTKIRRNSSPKKKSEKKQPSLPKPQSRKTSAQSPSHAPRPHSNPREDSDSRPRSALSFFAERLGVAKDALPPMTNGELMRIAEVNIPTLHGWQYRNRELPEAAITKLHEFFVAHLASQQCK